ncbi:MAG: hypothetical protein PHC68_05960 [Syntrophorhabdaceae bacterium]|nr:hypothetical protein [Syntrophorhabdaceae bacterium]
MYLKTRGLALIFAGLTLLPYSACADEILLKNGRTIQGDVISSNGSLLEVRTNLGTVSLRQEDVESVLESELPADFFQRKEEKDPGPEEAAPVKLQYSSVPAGGSSLALDICADYAGDRNLINVEGKTVFPDGSLIGVFVKGAGGLMLSGRCMVNKGTFDISFQTVGMHISKGNYSAEAVFIPDNQQPAVLEKMDKGASLTSATCTFSVGDEKEISESEKAARAALAPLAKELEGLYADLNDVVKIGLHVIDVDAQSVWSDRWRSRLKTLKRRIAEFNGSKCGSAVYYPYAQKSIADTADSLTGLYNMYFRDSQRSDSAQFANLNRECGNIITRIKEELSIQTGEDNGK